MRSTLSVVSILLVISGSFSSPALAQIDRLRVRQIDNGGEGDLAGTVTNALLIDFEGILGNQGLRLALTEGSVYQHPQGSNLPPDPTLFSTYPNLPFDTFLAMGGANSQTSAPVGEPVALPNRFERNFIDARWNSSNFFIGTQTDFLTARITLSGDAHGTWQYSLGLLSPPFGTVFPQGVIESGVMIVPEPASLRLALWAILVFVRSVPRLARQQAVTN